MIDRLPGPAIVLALSAFVCRLQRARKPAASPQAVAAPDQPKNSPHHHGALPADVVAKAALPLHGLRVKDDTPAALRGSVRRA